MKTLKVWFVAIVIVFVVHTAITVTFGFGNPAYSAPPFEPPHKPQCIRLKTGITVWFTGFNSDGEIQYYGAECLPNVGLMDHWEFDFDSGMDWYLSGPLG